MQLAKFQIQSKEEWCFNELLYDGNSIMNHCAIMYLLVIQLNHLLKI